MAHGVVLWLVTGVSGPRFGQSVTDRPRFGQSVTDRPRFSQSVTDRPRFGQSVTDRPCRTSVPNHQPTPLNVPEKRKPHLYQRENLTFQDSNYWKFLLLKILEVGEYLGDFMLGESIDSRGYRNKLRLCRTAWRISGWDSVSGIR